MREVFVELAQAFRLTDSSSTNREELELSGEQSRASSRMTLLRAPGISCADSWPVTSCCRRAEGADAPGRRLGGVKGNSPS